MWNPLIWNLLDVWVSEWEGGLGIASGHKLEETWASRLDIFVLLNVSHLLIVLSCCEKLFLLGGRGRIFKKYFAQIFCSFSKT